MWNGALPNPDKREAIRREWAKARVLPGYLRDLIATIPPQAEMTDVLRTAVSAMGSASFDGQPNEEQAVRIAAVLPSIIAFRRHRLAVPSHRSPGPICPMWLITCIFCGAKFLPPPMSGPWRLTLF